MGAPKIPKPSSKPSQDSQAEDLGFRARVISHGEAPARALARELEESLNGWLRLEVGWEDAAPAEGVPPSQVLFVDAGVADLDQQLAALDRSSGKTVFLIVRDGDDVPAALVEGRVDDVLVYPFRSLEVLSKLRHFQRMQAYREAVELNSSYAKLVDRLQEDLRLAEKLQKQRLPRRFLDVKGFSVTSRYLAGERSGGDYVDLAETRDGQSLAIVMTDASSYRLSSAVFEVVSRKLAVLSGDETRSCATAARRIRDGVLQVLSERDHLSLFYAVISRKDYRMRFLNLGGARVFYAASGKPFSELTAGRGDPIVRAMSVRTENEAELTLDPGGRLALVSDGFVEAAGGGAEVARILEQHRDGDAADALNELVFRAKKSLASPEDLPVQDCTAVLFDVDSRLIRLA